MNKLIARLIDTGMPREVAVCMSRQFRNRQDFERYVEAVEDECHEPMEAV